MEQLTLKQEREVNRLLAREFIESHLAVNATPESVEEFANFIEVFENKYFKINDVDFSSKDSNIFSA
jgi:hypothetical protein